MPPLRLSPISCWQVSLRVLRLQRLPSELVQVQVAAIKFVRGLRNIFALRPANFELPSNFIQSLGKVITSPVKGAVQVARSVFSFLLREDAADAELIQDAEKSEVEEEKAE